MQFSKKVWMHSTVEIGNGGARCFFNFSRSFQFQTHRIQIYLTIVKNYTKREKNFFVENPFNIVSYLKFFQSNRIACNLSRPTIPKNLL